MAQNTISAEFLTAVAGALLSLLFSYVPGLAEWYAALGGGDGRGPVYRRLLMLALLSAATLAVFGLACAGLLGDLGGPALACDRSGATRLVWAWMLAVMANQSAYLVAPRNHRR